MKVIIVLCFFAGVVYSRKGFGPGEQDWGYVKVRPFSHQFWWLYETTANVGNITERPLIMWIEGGPGSSGTAYGNFQEIGPLDPDLKIREHTWVADANLLFIDNPVGTGYSYVDNTSALATTDKQIATDLVACLKGFLARRPEFQAVPLYITGESYGGKMTAHFGVELDRQIKDGAIKANLKGVVSVGGWISPADFVMNWAPYLYNFGAIDQEDYYEIAAGARKTKAAMDAGQFELAFEEWSRTDAKVIELAKGLDYFNILNKIPSSFGKKGKRDLVQSGALRELSEDEKIRQLMNGPIKEALNINVTWGAQDDLIFDALIGDFMKPATNIVEELLNETSIKVHIVQGQLDLLVDTPGTVQWVDKLKWPGSKQWKDVPRDALSFDGINEGYQKALGQLSLFWVNRAGHQVGIDNPLTLKAIMKNLIGS